MSGISGVLIELAAIGNQDSYLNIRPRLTLFRGSYRRITNFAWCPINQDFSTSTNILGATANCNLPRAGDLVAQMYVRATISGPAAPAVNNAAQANGLCNGAGFILVNQAELTIGGYPFDRHSGLYNFMWNQLSHKPGQQEGATCVQGASAFVNGAAGIGMVNAVGAGGLFAGAAGPVVTGQRLYVPMNFWFNRFYAQALPMIALQYHEVKLNVTFATAGGATGIASNTVATVYASATANNNTASLMANYVFLDTVERRLFAATPHEYLIDQVHMPDGVGGVVVAAATLNYQPIVNHPVKEFPLVSSSTIWCR